METGEEVFLEEPAIEAELRECDAVAVVVEGQGCDAAFLSTWIAFLALTFTMKHASVSSTDHGGGKRRGVIAADILPTAANRPYTIHP